MNVSPGIGVIETDFIGMDCPNHWPVGCVHLAATPRQSVSTQPHYAVCCFSLYLFLLIPVFLIRTLHPCSLRKSNFNLRKRRVSPEVIDSVFFEAHIWIQFWATLFYKFLSIRLWRNPLWLLMTGCWIPRNSPLSTERSVCT